MQTADVASIEFGSDQNGRRTALVTIHVDAGDGPVPNPQAFNVEIILVDAGDPNSVADAAKKRFHQLMRDLAQQTEPWA